ncbi:MAG: ABC transporter ATP-binding protein [Proteobacteria bacterium]|nr:ABC transporter ATP-binding protein [Pseudomonadota bacterium]MBU1738257.1 ABC transporter ATP-binding protein [Pseudomonadota bacterium]
MIEVRELTKSYGETEALRGVSFSVKPGEVIGLLGPNGAGKTTLMKILTGYLHPTSGSAEVGGFDVVEHPGTVQGMIGYLPENAPLYPELTVQSQLKMVAELRNIPEPEQGRCLGEAIRAVGLEDRLTRRISTLSKGYRQRVGLAQAILHQPSVLILDEPTNGLDPTQIVEVRHLIRKLATRSTVLVSTHILSEVEATCDRAVIIMAGEVRADARLTELSSSTDALFTLELAPGDEDAVLRLASDLAGVDRVDLLSRDERQRAVFRVSATDGRELCPDIYDLARKNNWRLCELKRAEQTLEAVFNRLTTGEGGGR